MAVFAENAPSQHKLALSLNMTLHHCDERQSHKKKRAMVWNQTNLGVNSQSTVLLAKDANGITRTLLRSSLLGPRPLEEQKGIGLKEATFSL